MAGGKLLDKHGEMLLIDSLVKQYAVYSHDDIFNMEVTFAMSLVLLNRESAYVMENTQDIQKKINNSKRK